MTLHGDRPSEPRSGSASPANPTSATGAGTKRAASPKQDSLESVKRAKNGSDSPVRRTVIEVLNTPSVDSPLAKPEGAAPNDEYFKASDKKPSETPDSPKTAEGIKQDTTQESAPTVPETESKEVAEEITKSADAPRPDTPPMEAAPSAPAAPEPAPATNEDVTMAEPDASAAATAEPAVEAAPDVAEASAPTTAIETETQAATEKTTAPEAQPDSAQPSVVDPTPAAEAETTNSAPNPAPATAEATDPAAEPVSTAAAANAAPAENEEKKD